MISMIAAIGEGNRVLGKENKLVWNIPEDTKFFRDMTRGHPVIMGRRTFESLGRPLPQRANIVITRDKMWIPAFAGMTNKSSDVIVCYAIEEAIVQAKGIHNSEFIIQNSSEDEIFIIGGGQIYSQGIKFAKRLYLTVVHGNFEGDAFFPEYPEFKKIISERKSEGNGYRYTFFTLER